MRRTLPRVAVARRRPRARPCALALVGVLAFATLGAGPCGPLPGGRLDGEEAAPTADWSRLPATVACAVEVRPDDPRSVRATCRQHDGRLYVAALAAARKRWPALAEADPRVRVRIDGLVYALDAERVTDAAERARVLSDDPAESTWLWRLEPRTTP